MTYLKIIYVQLCTMPWLDITLALAALLVPIVAWRALSTWQKELMAKRQMQFWDELNDALHEYLILMQTPLDLHRAARNIFESQLKVDTNGKVLSDADVAKSYVEDCGNMIGPHMSKQLHEANTARIKLQSLASKGQVLPIDDYDDFAVACARLSNTYHILNNFAATISNTKEWFSSPTIVDVFHLAMSDCTDELDKDMVDVNKTIIEYIHAQYRRLFV
jgi:hypothetical protein